MSKPTVADVIAYIDGLYGSNAIHRKRGFPIRSSNRTVAAVHLAEEVVELQAAALLGNDPHEQLEEAADTLMVYLHLLLHLGLDFNNVVEFALAKLQTNWTTDPSEVTAVKPGLTRGARQ